MADNISTTPGAGASIAADDVGGILHQRVKISVGVDGTAADMQGPTADGISAGALLPASALTFNPGDSAWYRARAGNADALAGSSIAGATPMLFNGATHDRQRGNLEGTLLASAARTATTVTATQTNYNHRGVVIMCFATVVGTGTIQLSINGYASGLAFNLATGSAVGVQSAILMAYPGVVDADFPAAVGEARSVALPRTWDATVTKSDASSWTYSLTYALIL